MALSVRIEVALGSARSGAANRTVLQAPPAASWPFLYPLAIDLPSGPVTIEVPDIHEAFVDHQGAGTRLVTTQPIYQLLAWQDAAGERDVLMIGTGDTLSLSRHAPEILARRGPFADATLIDGVEALDATRTAPGDPAVEVLSRAFREDDPRERLGLCVHALGVARTAGALLATASVCMEVNDLDAAARDLDAALGLAPDWAAAHFERGKLWLRLEDMERASESFQAAATRLPRFGSAWANLGAALGELDRRADALDAFTRAIGCDPASPQIHNNIGVLNREIGNLPESEAAFRRVVELAPDLAFGYYNLGHTLFLQGRYQAALGAYAAGQQRDPSANPVQASRLAMCRLATGDPGGAVADLQRAASALPPDARQQLLADTQSIAWALLTHRPDLPGWQQVHAWLVAAQTPSQSR